MDIRYHDKAAKEIKDLEKGDKAERQLVAIIDGEVRKLSAFKDTGQRHTKEKQLHGDLSGISELVIYCHKNSCRVYFAVHKSTLWIVGIDPRKSTTDIRPGYESRLIARYGDVKKGVA